VVTVSSSAHEQVRSIPWDDLQHGHTFGPLPTYNLTKALNVLFTGELARRLAGTGVTANSVDPGFVRSGLGREATGGFGLFQASPVRGAATSVYLASSPEVVEISGRYFKDCRPTEPSALAQDRAAAERLWRLSVQLCGLPEG
jgi:NAD(P)-dependent dehydrogenase (short-subunit alcohol dehydrogenase family)